MLSNVPYYIGEYEPKQGIFDFESARELLIKEDVNMAEEGRLERLYNMIEVNSYTKYQETPDNKKILIYGLRHFETKKVDNFMLRGCESDDLYENDKLFNFWSKKFINEEMGKRDFQITGRPFMTLVKRNNLFTIQSVCY